MKSIYTLIISIFIFCNLNAQKKARNPYSMKGLQQNYTSQVVPNYLFTSNSNPVVLIMTVERMEDLSFERTSFRTAELNSETIRQSTEIVLVKGVNEQVERMNINPQGYSFVSQSIMMGGGEKMKAFYNDLWEKKPGYVILLTITSPLTDMNKKVEKGSFDLNKVASTLTIFRTNGKEGEKPYQIGDHKSSVVDIFDKLESEIKDKPRSYFIENMKINDEEYNQNFTSASKILDNAEKISAEGTILEGFPALKELRENKLLIQIFGIDQNDKNIEKFSKKIKGIYPYDFKVVNNTTMYSEMNKNEYKYILFLSAKTYIKVDPTQVSNKVKYHEGFDQSFFAVLRNLDNLETYIGTDKISIGRKPRNFHETAALDGVKAIVKYYQLENK